MIGALVFGLITWPLCFGAAYQAKGLSLALFLTVFPGCYPILVFVVVTLVGMLIPRIQTALPSHTVGALTRSVVEESYGSQALERDRWDDEAVWEDLVSLIESWGFPREKICPSTRFISDLKAYTL